MGMSALTSAAQPAGPAWQGRSIATQKLRLVEFSAFVEQQREPETYNKHLFVQIGGPVTYSDPLLEVYQTKLTEPNQTKPNQTKLNQTKPNQTKPNRSEPNQPKPNQTKLN